jgi:hypothetical protein
MVLHASLLSDPVYKTMVPWMHLLLMQAMKREW